MDRHTNHNEYVTLIEDNEGVVRVYEDLSVCIDYVLIETFVVDGIRYDLYRPEAVMLNRHKTQSLFRRFVKGLF